jgi:tetratricopeptide (TPR) repeat protein
MALKQWLLARCYAEQALKLYRKHGDLLATARILNNLGGLDFLLGDVDGAETRLAQAQETAAAAGSDADVAQALSSLAQVHLRSARPAEGRAYAQAALGVLAERNDFVDELGNAQLVVASSFVAEANTAAADEWFDRAECSFKRIGSKSHLAATFVARGDLRRSTGDVDAAADLYRRAAELLRDFHF